MFDLNYDVVVIGGGVLGCFAARSLTRYDLKIALLEKRGDICTGISRANTAIVYSGCDTKPGTMKTSMCVRAAKGFAALCEELGVRYSHCGSIMVCFGERGAGVLMKKLRDGAENGVQDLKLLTRGEVLALEPNISENVHSGLFVPDTGTVMPWELCFAAAENAAENGAEIILNAEVTGIARVGGDGFMIQAGDETYFAKSIINCAGMAADKLHETVSEPTVRIVPTAGDYFILDTKASGHIKHVIFHEPEEKGKGLTLVPTVDGNILVGPTERAVRARVREQGLGYETAHDGLDLLRALAAEVIPEMSLDHVIRSFGAIRPNPYFLRKDEKQGLEVRGRGLEDESMLRLSAVPPGYVLSDKSVSDFCIIESKDGAFISLVGVKTPGLTCANELGIYVADKAAALLGAARRELKVGERKLTSDNDSEKERNGASNSFFEQRRLPSVRLGDMSFEDREALVAKNPGYGRIVCRCRGISEGEMVDAINRFPGAVTPDGIKRRTGAGSGRCQGGFCGQSVTELINSNAECRMQNAELGDEGCDRGDAVPLCADYDIVVIGGGPAGMAAALSGADEQGLGVGGRGNATGALRVLLVERAPSLGGILNQCTHSGFGLSYFGEELTGREYASRFIKRVESSQIEVLTDTMVLDIDSGGVVTLSGKKTGLARVRAKAVVLASGCRERPIGALPVAGTRPEGVYTAGAAQKMINVGGYDIGNRFVILGSGDVGLIVARELVTRGKDVVAVIEKEDMCGGLPRNRINCLERFGIPLITRATVSEVHGIERVSGVTIIGVRGEGAGIRRRELREGLRVESGELRVESGELRVESGELRVESGECFIECDTLITSVGLIPERELLDGFAGNPPDWLFLCGNACFVHDVVDDVTEESERAGRFAAEFARAESGEVTGARGEGLGIRRRELRGELRVESGEWRVENGVCVGCPKGCVVGKTEDGWQGLVCGRNSPQFGV